MGDIKVFPKFYVIKNGVDCSLEMPNKAWACYSASVLFYRATWATAGTINCRKPWGIETKQLFYLETSSFVKQHFPCNVPWKICRQHIKPSFNIILDLNCKLYVGSGLIAWFYKVIKLSATITDYILKDKAWKCVNWSKV